jgi:hypothetical protein
MLTHVDIPVLVKGHGGTHDHEIRNAVPGIRLAGKVGPSGWSEAVQLLLAEWGR